MLGKLNLRLLFVGKSVEIFTDKVAKTGQFMLKKCVCDGVNA